MDSNTPTETKTPRTDENILTIEGGCSNDFDYVTPQFARQLEQELQQARTQSEHYRISIEDLQRGEMVAVAQRDNLQSQLFQVKEELATCDENARKYLQLMDDKDKQISQWQECARAFSVAGYDEAGYDKALSLFTQLTQTKEKE